MRDRIILRDVEGIARKSGTDEDGNRWTEFEADALAEQEPGECAVCGAGIASGWLCLDGGEEVCCDHVELAEEHDDEPEEGDYVIGHKGDVAIIGGRTLGRFAERDDAEQAIREDAACSKCWPSVWAESDHGNMHRVEDFDYDADHGRRWIDGEDYYGLPVFGREGKRYAFAKDAEEGRAAAGRHIEDSLWAFRPGFLLSFIEHEEHARGRVERALARLQEDLCEDANDLVRVLVGARLDALKAAAIAADSLGHFLAPYDGRENEEPDGGLSFRLD